MSAKCFPMVQTNCRSLCKRCVFRHRCSIDKNLKGCPCQNCLIKMVCTYTCNKADVFFAKAHKHFNKVAEEEYKTFKKVKTY